MREFVRGESFVLTACGYASARVEDDVIAGGDGLRIKRIGDDSPPLATTGGALAVRNAALGGLQPQLRMVQGATS